MEVALYMSPARRFRDASIDIKPVEATVAAGLQDTAEGRQV